MIILDLLYGENGCVPVWLMLRHNTSMFGLLKHEVVGYFVLVEARENMKVVGADETRGTFVES